MKLKRIAASILAFTMSTTLFGCELVSVNKEKDNAQVIVSIGDKTYTKEVVGGMAVSYLNMYGIDDVNSSAYDEFRISIANDFAKEKAFNYYAVANGYKDKLTQEDYTEIDEAYAKAQTRYDTELYEEVKKELGYTGEEGAPEFNEHAQAKVNKQVQEKQKEYLFSLGVTKLEDYKTELIEEKAGELYKTHLEGTVVIGEEEIQKEYNTRMADQKSNFDSKPKSFMEANDNGEVIVYNPAGFRRVKNLLIKIDENSSAKIKALEDEIASLSAGENKTNKQNELAAVKKAAYDAIAAKANEALNKAKAGESFDALIEKYGEDEGATTNPQGYLMHADVTDQYVSNFQSAGMALEKVGDVSGLVETEFGYHILMYASDVSFGEIPLSNVKEDLLLGLTAAAKSKTVDEKTTEIVDKYKNEGVLKVYADRMALAKIPGKK